MGRSTLWVSAVEPQAAIDPTAFVRLSSPLGRASIFDDSRLALPTGEWFGRLTAEDQRALTPLIWGHVNPYGLFRLDMNTRLAIERADEAAA